MTNSNYGDSNDPVSVSQLTGAIKQSLNEEFQSVWVTGEISNLARPRSGHMYLALKDEGAVLQAAIWRSVASRLKFDLADGLKVVCRGDIDVYPPRGSYQLIIRDIVPEGIGSLQLAFQQLFEKLQREGLFEDHLKRPLPRIPRTVAFVTSPTGAAVRDFLEVIRRRWPDIRVLVVPAKVQGQGASQDIVRGIQRVNALRGADRPEVLVVGRGGGSLEDLWCFNEEPVVRAVRQSDIPVVSAVGHEIDVVLSDLAADVRALTPTEAAERIVPNVAEVSEQLAQTQARLVAQLRSRAIAARGRLDALANRQVLRSPLDRIRQWVQQIDQRERQLHGLMQHRLELEQQQLKGLSERLEAISPLAVLARGYSITTRPGESRPITRPSEVSTGDTLETRLHQGRILTQVTQVETDDG